LVQVVKDPWNQRGKAHNPYQLGGRLSFICPWISIVVFPRKIEKPEERQRLRDILKTSLFLKAEDSLSGPLPWNRGKKKFSVILSSSSIMAGIRDLIQKKTTASPHL